MWDKAFVFVVVVTQKNHQFSCHTVRMGVCALESSSYIWHCWYETRCMKVMCITISGDAEEGYLYVQKLTHVIETFTT